MEVQPPSSVVYPCSYSWRLLGQDFGTWWLLQWEKQSMDWQLLMTVPAQTLLLCLPTQPLALAAWSVSLIPLPEICPWLLFLPSKGTLWVLAEGILTAVRIPKLILTICAPLIKPMCFKPCCLNSAAHPVPHIIVQRAGLCLIMH